MVGYQCAMAKQPKTINPPPITTTTTPDLLTPSTVAGKLGVRTRTLEFWRQHGGGPPYVRLGDGPRGRVRYPSDSLAVWIDQRRQSSTAENYV